MIRLLNHGAILTMIRILNDAAIHTMIRLLIDATIHTMIRLLNIYEEGRLCKIYNWKLR